MLPFSVDLAMEEAVEHSKRGAHRVMLYCDGLVLFSVSEVEVVECFNMCESAMKRRGLKVNN